MDEVPHHEKVRVTSMHLDDLTLQWHGAYMRGKAYLKLPYPSWEEYIWALLDRFGAEFDDPMSELVKLKQTGGVVEFQEAFDIAMTRLNLEPGYDVSIFLEGLKLELGDAVRILKPYSLSQAYHLARL